MEKEENGLLERLNAIGVSLLNKIAAEKEAPVIESRDSLANAIEKRTKRLTAFPIERIVLERIFDDNPDTHPDCLKIIRKDYDMEGSPLLLQYELWYSPTERSPYTTYIYVHEGNKRPEFLGVGRVNTTFEKHPGTVLLKMDADGKLSKVPNWDKKKEETEEEISENGE